MCQKGLPHSVITDSLISNLYDNINDNNYELRLYIYVYIFFFFYAIINYKFLVCSYLRPG